MEKKAINNKRTPAFLRLVLAKLESSKLSNGQFVALSKLYAEAAGLKMKAAKKIKAAKSPAPAPAVMPSEIEQMLQIESAQRKDHGTR